MTLKFFEQLSQDFTQLLESEYDYNVVIEVGKQPNVQLFKAHSVILYQRSLYFRQELENATKKNNVIEIKLPLVPVTIFNIMIKYIYGGILSLENFEVSTIFDLLVAGNELKFTELVKHLQSHLINNHASWLRLNFSRAYQISLLSESFEPLQQFYNDIIVKHPSIIFNSDDFTNLQESTLITLLKNDNLQMGESEIWDKVILWGKANTPDLPSDLKDWTDENFKSLKATLQHCLPHIRYFQILGKDVLIKIKPYRNILKENLWDDIMSNLVDPDIPITSQILPPRCKETAQLYPRETSIITPSSSIITLQHAAEISSWIDRRSTIYDITNIPYNFKLLLRGGRDDFTGETFHRICDNIPGTVIVLKVSNTDEILGGYNPLVWKYDNSFPGKYDATADSFIFSLKNGNIEETILSRVNCASNAIYYGTRSQGPWFSGSDLGMGSVLKRWYCSKYAYDKPIRSSTGWFFIDDYEVFQIYKNISNFAVH
ncbi:hypothetical protein C2G38_2141527 [Gigaspora rosea]|uniref:TLD-domain-containing protein n=1 Tax=Gigaspora rosea TaxID=44941 RepID=A0A397VIJ5_9GLOM|nr:hypothetical protein C2G38_2141527 [Gigaspora rosea]